jgi:hypothetical protein
MYPPSRGLIGREFMTASQKFRKKAWWRTLIGKEKDVPSQEWTNHPSGGYVGEGTFSIESMSGGTKR